MYVPVGSIFYFFNLSTRFGESTEYIFMNIIISSPSKEHFWNNSEYIVNLLTGQINAGRISEVDFNIVAKIYHLQKCAYCNTAEVFLCIEV